MIKQFLILSTSISTLFFSSYNSTNTLYELMPFTFGNFIRGENSHNFDIPIKELVDTGTYQYRLSYYKNRTKILLKEDANVCFLYEDEEYSVYHFKGTINPLIFDTARISFVLDINASGTSITASRGSSLGFFVINPNVILYATSDGSAAMPIEYIHDGKGRLNYKFLSYNDSGCEIYNHDSIHDDYYFRFKINNHGFFYQDNNEFLTSSVRLLTNSKTDVITRTFTKKDDYYYMDLSLETFEDNVYYYVPKDPIYLNQRTMEMSKEKESSDFMKVNSLYFPYRDYEIYKQIRFCFCFDAVTISNIEVRFEFDLIFSEEKLLDYINITQNYGGVTDSDIPETYKPWWVLYIMHLVYLRQ